MPWFDYICETCGHEGRAQRTKKQGPPRFCSLPCKNKGLSLAVSGKSLRPPRWVISPFMAEKIRRVYQESTGNGEVEALAARLGLPRWKISRYAAKQGWVAVQRREGHWSEAEIHILESHAHCTAAVIRNHLKKGGYQRTEQGIILKRKRMHLLSNLGGQSATSLAQCFGVDAKTVTRWIGLGYLIAGKRGTARTCDQGGDMWFIKDKAIREFVLSCPELVDLHKVDKLWLFNLLAPDWTYAGDRVVSEGRGFETQY